MNQPKLVSYIFCQDCYGLVEMYTNKTEASKWVLGQTALFFFLYSDVATEHNEGGLRGHIPLHHLRTNSIMKISNICYIVF